MINLKNKTIVYEGQVQDLPLHLFLVLIFFFIFPFKVQSIEDGFTKKDKDKDKIELDRSISIQEDLDKINLQLRSENTPGITALYIPSYGVAFHVGFRKKILPVYSKIPEKEIEKKNYMEQTSIYNSIVKRLVKNTNIKDTEYITVDVLSANLLVQRIIQFRYLKELYSRNSELNIIQSILKFESDPNIMKTRILKNIAEDFKCTIIDMENDPSNSIITITGEIENKVKENTEFKVICSLLPDFGIIVQTMDLCKEEQEKDLVINIGKIAYNIIKKSKNNGHLIIGIRKHAGMLGGKWDLQNIFSDNDLVINIIWWNFGKRTE